MTVVFHNSRMPCKSLLIFGRLINSQRCKAGPGHFRLAVLMSACVWYFIRTHCRSSCRLSDSTAVQRPMSAMLGLPKGSPIARAGGRIRPSARCCSHRRVAQATIRSSTAGKPITGAEPWQGRGAEPDKELPKDDGQGPGEAARFEDYRTSSQKRPRVAGARLSRERPPGCGTTRRSPARGMPKAKS